MQPHFAQTPPIELVSIGDSIDEGTYVVHSRFHRVINFVRQHGVAPGISSDRVVSLVKEEIGAGPSNIVVRGLNFHTIHSLLITKQSLYVNNCPIDFDESKRYNSTVHFAGIDIEKFEKRFDLLETFLLRLSPSKSLAFLLDEKRKQDFHQGFEQAVAERLQADFHEIFHGNVFNGVRMIKGLGFGLTPSGDDFIIGFLVGLFVLQNVYGKELSEIRRNVYRLAVGDNLISNTFLYCAKEGLLFERWKSLISALLYAEENEMYEAIPRLLSVGETSGADAAVGFLLTLKKWGQS